LPSEDEWYKAAYYDGSTYYDYPTGTDTVPDNNLPSLDSGNSANFKVGPEYTTGDSSYPMTDAGAYTLSPSPYGTFDQGGNVWEWNEAHINVLSRKLRGGSWGSGSGELRSSAFAGTGATSGSVGIGFRVATVPEPGTAVLAMVGCVLMLWWSKRRK
jgi:formylglycine-generating enzyme required for sulfatase activity